MSSRDPTEGGCVQNSPPPLTATAQAATRTLIARMRWRISNLPRPFAGREIPAAPTYRMTRMD